MKKSLITVLSLTALLSLGACNSSSLSTITSTLDETSFQLIKDNRFEKGFSCEPASGTRPDDGWFPDERWNMNVDLTYGENVDDNPVWILAQHGDLYALNDVYNRLTDNKPEFENGYYTFKDTSKQVSVNPTTGSLYLELNTSKEYTRPRKPSEQWSHLLLQQGFDRAVSLGEVDSVDFTMDIEMKKFEDHMEGQANPSVHATQFLMYLVIKSDAALDANDFFWFGIPFFDNRYPNGLPESGMVDAGGAGATSKFIYGMPSADYLPNGVKLNTKSSINVDIKPYIGSALIKAQSMGYFVNSELSQLYFQAMNIGFEIPGTYDCGIEISNYSLTANYMQ